MNQYMIEHLKSGLSINSHIGCSLKCRYCVLSNISDYPDQPQMIAMPNTIVEKLFDDNSLYIRDRTPIFINNRTDPLLPQVIESTYSFLDYLSKEKTRSPIIIISKLAPSKNIIKYFDLLNILFIYTYTALPKGYDYNSNDIINSENMRKIREYVPFKNRFHYFRPIIPGLNDSEECFKKAVHQVGQYCRSTIIGGVRIVSDTINPEYKISKINKEHKIFDLDYWSIIKQLSKNNCLNIVRHTSCAISIFMNNKIKLDYFGNPEHCHSECSNYNVCNKNYESIHEQEISKYLFNICDSSFVFGNNSILFADEIRQEIVSSLKCAYGLHVQANKIKLSPSEANLLE